VLDDLHHKSYQKSLLNEISDLKAVIAKLKEQATMETQKHMKQMDTLQM